MRLALLAAMLCAAPSLSAQWLAQWSGVDDVPPPILRLVYDVAGQRLLALTATAPPQLWSFDGTRWREHQPGGLEASSGTQPGLVLADYDRARAQAVAVTAATQRRTAVGDRAGFRQLTVSGSPDTSEPGVAFGGNANELVVFGGRDALGSPTDTMRTWNGAAWTLRTPAVRPAARSSPGMACDRLRNRIVLFGGAGPTGVLGDTWEWDGATWTQFAPATAPAPRSTTMAYDPVRQRVAALGGFDANYTPFTDCWEWNGAQWTPRGTLPAGTAWCVATDDGASLVIATGSRDLWRAAGTGWTSLWTDPRPRTWDHALAYDPTRGETVLAAGSLAIGTWAWNGTWQQRATTGPSPRGGAALAPFGTDLILFGGSDPTLVPLVLYDETWRWNGTAWSQLQLATRPPHRRGHTLTDVGGALLLFGGFDVTGELADTWRFDGAGWTALQPAAAPPARYAHMVAFDALRQRAVLFGGFAQSVALQDTWEWDGGNWLPVASAQQPYGGAWPMAFDGSTVVLQQVRAVWVWSGGGWSSGLIPSNPELTDARMVHDASRQRLLLQDYFGELHVFGPTPARAQLVAQSCGGRPDLRLFGRFAIGTTSNVHVEGAANAAAFAVFGLQSQQVAWAPGCAQLVSADAVRFAALDGLGRLDVPFPVPASNALRGVAVKAQALVLDGGPVFGASLSSALSLVAGD